MPENLDALVRRLGGVADRATLVRLTSRAAVDSGLRDGRLVVVARGRYALPTIRAARRSAAALHGVVSHRSAAAHWGWEMLRPPDLPCITVPTNRKVAAQRRADVELHWSRVATQDVVDDWVTRPSRTVIDCCRDLPFGEALAIADSALRNGDLTQTQLLRRAEAVRGAGRSACRRVAREATGRADNPFESALRAIALDVPGLQVRPQVLVVERPFAVRPDLVDERLRLALEADSFEWHGSRAALDRDCRRYNLLVTQGWRVLRFSWQHVMLDPAYVASTLSRAVAAT